ncbi:MAG: InlB B-repeat-containing protein [Oscillospiraceae bacterium]|nr:InlB B-repeat-containing protein [Oscillospiraceae bacterium]
MVKRQTYYGSGTMYEFVASNIKDASGNVQIPSTKEAIKTFAQTWATAESQIGFLKNGFQVEITTEKLEDQSDLGEMKITLITKENATGTFALFNSCGETLSRLYPTAHTVSDVTTVGGLANTTQDDHVLLFVSANKNDDGEQTVFIALGKNTEGFSINWNPDSVEPMSCKYDLVPFNTAGNLFRIAEVSGLPNLPVTSGDTYTISYIENGGVWADGYEPPASYTHDASSTDDIDLPTSSNITKTGATFGGWYEVNALTTQVTEIDVSVDTGNKTFVAKWT